MKMIEVLILKYSSTSIPATVARVLNIEIEDPGCFWVIVKGCGPFVDREMEYKKLHAEMNQFYNRDVEEVKPLTLEEGQVCVVFCQELKCWCRAVVKSILFCADHYLAECFLVDYAKYTPVKTKNIRVAVEAFMQLPYRAKKFRLYCTKPVTLRIDLCEDAAEIVPAKRWDSAAIQYFQNLLKGTTQIEAKLCAIEDDNFDVYLYVTINDEKVCVNDDLVAKNFARYVMTKENTVNSAKSQKPWSSLSLKSSPEKVISPALALWPMLMQGKVHNNLETSGDASNSFLEKTCRKIAAPAFNGTTESAVRATVGFSFKENINISAQPTVRVNRLLQFLNPDPLKTDNINYEQQEFQKINTEQPPIVLSNKIEPCSVLETTPLLVDLKKELLRNKFLGPNLTESYCWPPIARGCDSVVISHHGNDPLLYIPPVLTFLQSGSCYKSLPTRNGPIALIICPGWRKAQLVFELLEEYGRCSRPLHPMLVLLGVNKEEAKNVKLQRGCEVIVTTPYSLLRLLEHHSLLFLRLCHLVFDEVDNLFSEASKQIFTILEYYKKTITTEERESAPHQIVAVGSHWSKHIEHLTKEFMNDPYIVITAMEEASIYGNVQQVVQLCLNCERTSVLLQILDFTPSKAQKTLIFTNSVDETEMVYKAVESSSIFCLKVHKEIEFHFKYAVEQWKKKFSSGTHVVLVLTDDCMPSLGITDANCVVHFSFPASPRVFGVRLHSMSDNFQNVLEKGSSVDQVYTKAKSILLLTERNGCHAVGVLRYLEHTEAKIPPELCDFTTGVLEAKEDKKLARPLCQYLKRSGVCKDMRICPDRHQVRLQIDLPQKMSDNTIPMAGCVTIVPLHIVDATNYFGRIIDKQKDQYAILDGEMIEYFKKARNKVSVEMVEKLALYGLHEEGLFHRVQVLEIPPKEENCFIYNVTIRYIDEGRTGQVQVHRLFHLPTRFQILPPQAVEFIVCRVKPIDNEIEWNPKVTRYIHHKIRGKLHEAKIVLALGNTIWVDPMVRVTKLSELKTSINEYNIRSEILSMGMGIDNPEHIKQLQKLCKHAKTLALEEKTFQNLMLSFTPKRSVLEQDADSPQSVLEQDADSPQSVLEQDVASPHSLLMGENFTDICNSSPVTLENHQCDTISELKKAEESTQHHRKCFYPEIKWFQKEDIVTLKIKLRNIRDYKCDFFGDKVVFSAFSGDKFYVADMELHANILEGKSVCVIKNEEPVIILAKDKKEFWCRLLKHKNPNVSFDFEHWEDFEDKSPFPVGAQKAHHSSTLITEEMEEFSEDSGTESDD
ncbi:putative ATP-dependent RNA helicase TDRD12 isoform X2 [Mauremys reevesii]|uniref:putative ATP-dependent RNA helicase TDRD12 isoform X2 n=1 Tax=Mauremys reevesii TaxID=260615 RepID=UPI00193EF050|nr:putative ATP-dependent RNA helicase TDRD12 isoform X2 [Mauremys reevesii]